MGRPIIDEDRPPRVLVVDDNASVLDLFRKILGPDPGRQADTLDALEATLFDTQAAQPAASPVFTVDCLQDGEQACRRARQAVGEGHPYAVAFIDMRMPGGWDGLQTIEALWQVDPDIHVVICTAFSDHTWTDIVRRLGLSDRLLVLRKPFDKIEVLQLASSLSRKWGLHRKQQADMDMLERRVQERTHELSQALTEREAYSNKLQYQATHDALTGLANRELLHDSLSRAIAYAVRYGHPVWVVFLDLDHFKTVNDMLGHKAGDVFLNAIAQRLRTAVRETDTVARLGGDEFVLILPGPAEGNLFMGSLQRIMDVIAQPIHIEDREFSLSCSVGVAVFPDDGKEPEKLIEHADIAMYRAKEIGRNNFQFFTQAMNDRLLERLNLEEALKNAVKREEFVLHYQPQVDLRTGMIAGMEALVRWQHPDLGLVPPIFFIKVAEETGLIVPLGAWVIRAACAQARAWQEAGLRPLRVAVNLSALQLAHPELVSLVATALRDTGLEPKYLEIEITESSVMANVEYSIGVLRELKALGVHLSVDDFGTGYSSLAYLKKFPIDVLKIDQSFVREMTVDPDDAAIVRSIISLAHSLRLNVIAEGVETGAQLAYLHRHGCDHVQGFHFSRPLAVPDSEDLLRQERSWTATMDDESPSQETLLIVDDDAKTLTLLTLHLGQEGYRILIAKSAAEGFDILARHRVQVIVCDHLMPEMSGIDFLSRVKDLHPDAVRLVLSNADDSSTVREAINRGAVYRYFTKPWNSDSIQKDVREAFAHYWRTSRRT
jgi:diguanylate cyclase (GGDEF)-like protein